LIIFACLFARTREAVASTRQNSIEKVDQRQPDNNVCIEDYLVFSCLRKPLLYELAMRCSSRSNKGSHKDEGGKVPIEVAKRSASIVGQKRLGQPLDKGTIMVAKKEKILNPPLCTTWASRIHLVCIHLLMLIANTPIIKPSEPLAQKESNHTSIPQLLPLTTLGSTSPCSSPAQELPNISFTTEQEPVSLQRVQYPVHSQMNRFLLHLLDLQFKRQ
jgi:hypothetical protein